MNIPFSGKLIEKPQIEKKIDFFLEQSPVNLVLRNTSLFDWMSVRSPFRNDENIRGILWSSGIGAHLHRTETGCEFDSWQCRIYIYHISIIYLFIIFNLFIQYSTKI